ncbi:MAG: 4Fe-4S binding protein [Anaerolineales bacterium]
MSETDRATPEIDRERCTLCGDCVEKCPEEAVHIHAGEVIIDEELCEYCGECEDICPMGAIALPYEIVMRKTQGSTKEK